MYPKFRDDKCERKKPPKFQQISRDFISFNIILWKLLPQILQDTLRWGFPLVLIIGYQHSLHKIEPVYLIKGVNALSQEYSIEPHP